MNTFINGLERGFDTGIAQLPKASQGTLMYKAVAPRSSLLFFKTRNYRPPANSVPMEDKPVPDQTNAKIPLTRREHSAFIKMWCARPLSSKASRIGPLQETSSIWQPGTPGRVSMSTIVSSV